MDKRFMTAQDIVRLSRLLDFDSTQSLLLWFFKGIDPGSFTTECILGEFDSAYDRAHPSFKYGHGIAVWASVSLALHLPWTHERTYENVKKWSINHGLVGATDAEKVYARLNWNEDIFGKWPHEWLRT